MALPTYHIYQDKKKHWHGTLKSANGKVLMTTPPNEQYQRIRSVLKIRKYLGPHKLVKPDTLKLSNIKL